MALDVRSLFRRQVRLENGIRVTDKAKGDLVGYLLDASQTGFRLNTKRRFKPGQMLEGLIAAQEDGDASTTVQVTAQCVWNESRETGFVIKNIPVADEETFDRLIEKGFHPPT